MTCIDSNVLINFLRNKPQALSAIHQLNKKNEELITTSVNSFELLRGASNLSKLKEDRVRNFLGNFTILDFDFESSKKAAEIFNTLKEKGSSLDIADVMIAAIAITNNQSLLTENKKHFDRIEGLTLEVIATDLNN
ncbi:MAG: type II toxin-antitoxin system VapC family toxin [Nanoarchaeota archaeon]